MLKAISAKVLELKCCQIQEYNNEKVINFDARILINLKSSRQKMFNKTENVKQKEIFVSFIRTITNNFFDKSCKKIHTESLMTTVLVSLQLLKINRSTIKRSSLVDDI